jgi:hypothetical protein
VKKLKQKGKTGQIKRKQKKKRKKIIKEDEP